MFMSLSLKNVAVDLVRRPFQLLFILKEREQERGAGVPLVFEKTSLKNDRPIYELLCQSFYHNFSQFYLSPCFSPHSGIKVIGGISEEEEDDRDFGIFIKKILNRGLASKDGESEKDSSLYAPLLPNIISYAFHTFLIHFISRM